MSDVVSYKSMATHRVRAIHVRSLYANYSAAVAADPSERRPPRVCFRYPPSLGGWREMKSHS